MQLSNEKLIELIQKDIFPKEHLERLYNQNRSLMVAIIKRTLKGAETSDLIEELLQECYIILCDVVKSYDMNSGVKFSTYFSRAVQWGIYRYTANNTSIRLPRHFISKINQYKKLCRAQYDDTDIIRNMGIDTAELDLIKQCCSSILSLDKPLNYKGDSDSITIADTIADTSSGFEDDVINSADDKIFYNLVKSILPERHFKVIKMIYWQGMSYVDISKILGVTHQYIAQLRIDALRKLRNNIRIINYRNEY